MPQEIRFDTNFFSIFKTKYDVSSTGETQFQNMKRKTIVRKKIPVLQHFKERIKDCLLTESLLTLFTTVRDKEVIRKSVKRIQGRFEFTKIPFSKLCCTYYYA